MFKEKYEKAIELLYNNKNDDVLVKDLRKNIQAEYDSVYIEGYRDALIWALSLKESCGDWLNEDIKEELDSLNIITGGRANAPICGDDV